jgi:CheY-like chemotaxis protein
MLSIYLIDDDKLVNYLNREMIKSMKANCQIVNFESAAIALESLKTIAALNVESFPSWIFLDINMPVMDGWEFLEQYAQIPAIFRQYTKICLLSSSIDRADLERSAINPNVWDYLIKPLDEDQLARIGLSN